MPGRQAFATTSILAVLKGWSVVWTLISGFQPCHTLEVPRELFKKRILPKTQSDGMDLKWGPGLRDSDVASLRPSGLYLIFQLTEQSEPLRELDSRSLIVSAFYCKDKN